MVLAFHSELSINHYPAAADSYTDADQHSHTYLYPTEHRYTDTDAYTYPDANSGRYDAAPLSIKTILT